MPVVVVVVQISQTITYRRCLDDLPTAPLNTTGLVLSKHTYLIGVLYDSDTDCICLGVVVSGDEDV